MTVLSGCTSPTPAPTATPVSGGLKDGLPATLDYSLQVTGGTGSPVTLSYADLKAMEFTELKGVSTVNSVGTETVGDYVGVPMSEIAKKAGLPAGEVSYKVTASDGYGISYTKEQYEKAVLALKTDGSALNANINDDKSCIRMVIPGETKNMWMKVPAKVEIVQGAAQVVALRLRGNVTDKKDYTVDDLKKMDQKTYTFDDKNNQTVTVTGVSLNYLLDQAGVQSGATGIMFTDASGTYSKTINLADIRANQSAIVAIDSAGNLRNYVWGQPFNTRVSNLTTIRVLL
jgi:DMSO/TMAO reductase YedYZ molybdopterin-dependent catalytic subunit